LSAHSEIAQPVTSSGDAAQAEWRWLDRIAPLSAVCVLIASCLLSSSRKDMWLDEGFTLELLGDRSFSHMMRALVHAADGGMPLYYIVAYGWGRVFGLSLLSLRLLSSLFICAGVLLLWSTLRKYFSLTAVSLAMTATVTTSALVLTHNAQARYYGLYFATAALVFALHALLAQTPHPGGKLLSGAILAHVALIMSHPFGLLYSVASICALLVSDYRWGKVRAGLYAMLASSWLILVLWVVPLLNLHDVAVPRNWPPPLDFSDVVSLYSFSSPCVVMVIFVVVALTALGRPAESRELRADDPRPLMTCATAFLIPPLLIAVLSVGESSFFVNRYFIPSLVGVTAIVTSLFDLRLRRVKSSVPLKIAWLVMFVVFLAWPIGSALSLNDKRFVTMDRNLPNGVPVIVTDAQAFLPLTYLSHKADRPYYFPLDWNAALHSASRGMTVEDKLMRNSKAAGYSVDRILESEQLRCAFDSFLVVDNPRYEWFQTRIVRNRDYQVQMLGPGPHELQVWSVKRVGNATCR
jgi:uncharacterized membrane protein